MVTRRQVLQSVGVAGLTLLAGCGRLPGQAQESTKPVRLGYLTSTDGTDVKIRNSEAFLQGMREHGYIEGQNLLIERRSGGGRLSEVQPQELSAPVAELVALPVDVIFAAGGTIAAVAARQATSTIPIVSATGDLVGVGLVASLARPGGNVTGLTTISPQLSGKRIELLKEAVPGVSRVAVIWNPGSATASSAMRETQAAAESLGLEVYPLPVRSPSALEAAFETARAQVDAVTVMGDPLTLSEAVQIASLAARSRLAYMAGNREHWSYPVFVDRSWLEHAC